LLSFGVTFADVSITGSINQTYSASRDNGVVANIGSVNAFGDRNTATGDSYLTFSGSEDLGDGIKASFKVEPRVNISGKDASSSDQKGLFGANREAWIGLSGAFGTVHLGNNYTPLFLRSVAAYDVNGSANAAGYLVSNITTFNATNSIDYTAPTFVDGLGIQLNKNTGRSTAIATKDASADTSAGDSIGWGISYNAGALSAGLAGETTKNTALIDGVQLVAAPSKSDSIKKTGYGASYNFGVAKVSVNGLKATSGSSNINTFGYGASVPFGAVTLNASYSTLKDKGLSNDSFTGYQIGANYAFSKRTSVYLLINNVQNTTDKTTLTINSLGVVHNF
jgi:predicted porin